MKTPSWIDTIVNDVTGQVGIKKPKVVVRKIQRGYSGFALGTGEQITIRYSSTTPMWQKKMVVLHELAHCIVGGKEHHSVKFWDIAFTLYKEYKLPIRKCRASETNYKRTAEDGYRLALNLKPRTVKRKRRILDTVAQMNKRVFTHSIIGIKDTPRGAWAVTQIIDEHKWRGYKISKKLYKTLAQRKLYDII